MKKLLLVIDMQIDFIDGALGTPEAEAIVDKVVEKISQNQTLYTQLMAAQAQMAQMAQVIDGLTGGSTNLTGNMAARTEATANQDSPNKAEAKTTTTDAVGGTLAGDSLAVQARRRAQNAADPNK